MRKVYAGLFSSIDGVVERPNEWQPAFDEEMGAALSRMLDGQDAVLLDVVLPDGNGMALLERIRQEGRPARVAIVTAVYLPAFAEELEELRPDAVFRKPLNVEALLEWLATASNSL